MKKRIAIVNQRYGININGGSEYYTRMLAEHLRDDYDIEILTTCAEDYTTWKNVYQKGTEIINQVSVRRFPVSRQRNMNRFRIINKLTSISGKRPVWLEHIWAKEQGPYAPELIDYIEKNSGNYDIFIFVTYLYYLTLKGIEKVAEKSVLIPTAHDEPYLYYGIYKKVFTCPRAIVYLTEEEKQLVNRVFDNAKIENIVAGIGIDVPVDVAPDSFKKKYGITGRYLLYAGRIDEGKNCRQMFEYFIRYKQETSRHTVSGGIKLVLVGKVMMNVPEHPDIIKLGYLEEKEKYDAMVGACALWLPSEYESLSIVVLEAMALGVPVIVNGRCEVLKGHCVRSGAGTYYLDYGGLKKAIENIKRIESRQSELKEKARAYIEQNYTWNLVTEKYRKLIDGEM